MRRPPHNAALVLLSMACAASLVTAILALRAATPAADSAGPRATNPARLDPHAPVSSGLAELDRRLQAVEAALAQAGVQPAAPGDAAGSAPPTSDRLDQIEARLAEIGAALDGISLEPAVAERDARFRAADGHLKADAYAAAGKHAIAGEGYLTFLEAHPEHPEGYDILKRARDAFQRAGYHDRAIWAQQEVVRNLGDAVQPEDLLALAQLERADGRYDDAIANAELAAEASPTTQQRLWNRLYWAWFNQLRDGNAAGLEAYRRVEQEIADAGLSDHKLGEQVRAKITEIEASAAADGDG